MTEIYECGCYNIEGRKTAIVKNPYVVGISLQNIVVMVNSDNVKIFYDNGTQKVIPIREKENAR